MRDADRFKDKIEVSLDSRQIFFLFFGGAVVACLVFVLGVMVGKRLEGRERVARKAATSTTVDPLAALDELGADDQKAELAFPNALAGEKEDRQKPLGAIDVAPPPAPAPAKQPEKPAAVAKIDPPKPAPPKVDPPKVDPPKVDPPKKDHDNSKGRYTLQLSSFQDRGEADAFVAKLKDAGYQPNIAQREVDGRGTFYRVRVGEYSTHDEAIAAKSDFEKRQHIIAYVSKL
jgi:cell division septation protein DedD